MEKDLLLDTPDNARELFNQFSQISHGFSTLDVVNAALNVLVNAIRQAEPTRQGAERVWDECVARSKGVLLDGYNSAGRKKGIYPYTQTLIANRAIFKMRKPE